MSSVYAISLNSDVTVADSWKANTALVTTASGATIQLTSVEADNLMSIQRAARKLDNLGLSAVSLVGKEWDLERQWAFARGFMDTLSNNQIHWSDADPAVADKLSKMLDITSWSRELTNLPPNAIYPESLAERVQAKLTEIAPEHVTATVIKGDELLKQGWVGIHSVGRASKKPPLMLVLDYNPTGDAAAPTAAALIGKGITFDSGGYSIKSSEGMLAMKCDMGGAATVAGALGLAIHRGLQKRVQLILCCAENLIDGSAYKLGDILTYKNGLTVEIVNTDAEGRLVLADGLLRAEQTKAPLVIDAATLTGAAHVAVGSEYNALFSVDQELAQQSLAIAAEQQELLWQLPLQSWHKKNCPSPFADTANSRPQKGGGAGGASNAAGFLLNFAPRDGQGWLHFDIAAAYHNAPNAMFAAGATGQGIRTIAEHLLRA